MGPLPGKGSIGALIGLPFFLADEDTKNGQSPRILGQMQFQYMFTPKWRMSVQFGYGWIGYKAGTPAPYKMRDPATGDSVQVMDDVLTKFQPISVTMVRALKPRGKGWSPYAGAGVNITRIEIVNDRDKIKDPATFDAYVNWSPGVQGLLGAEYFLPSNKNVSLEWSARGAYQFSKDEESFPSGFTGPHALLTINFGVNVHFWPIGYKPSPSPAVAPAPESAPAPAPAGDAGEPAPAPMPAPTPTPSGIDTLKTPPPPSPKEAPLHEASILFRGAAAADTSVNPLGGDAPACTVEDIGPMLGVPTGATHPRGR
jgi:opacity protein-like surface antigen